MNTERLRQRLTERLSELEGRLASVRQETERSGSRRTDSSSRAMARSGSPSAATWNARR